MNIVMLGFKTVKFLLEPKNVSFARHLYTLFATAVQTDCIFNKAHFLHVNAWIYRKHHTISNMYACACTNL